jgi:ribosome maturation factor RimP
VRIFIDKPKGVDVEDCARVSSHLTRLFAVENVDFERLEVSSPGLDRPLKKAADFVRFAGAEAELRLVKPIENAKKLKGVLRGCGDGGVVLETATGTVTIPFAEIARARLVPKIEWRKAR